MPTATQFVTWALQDLKIIGADEGSASGENLAVGLERLQELIDAWAIDGLTMPTISRNVFNIVSGTSTYTIGTGATFNVARPKAIDSAAYIPDPAASTIVEIPIEVFTPQRYAQYPVKSDSLQYPDGVFYDHGYNASGYGSIILVPIPSSSTPDLVLYLQTALTGFSDAVTNYGFAPGTRSVIRSQLAQELEDLFPGASLSPRYLLRADRAMSKLKAQNAQPIELGMDPYLLLPPTPNIYTGDC